MRVAQAGLVYFGLIFGVGFLFGPIREWWAVPQFGPVGGLLIEAVIIVPVIYVVARRTVIRFDIGAAGQRLQMGAIALGLLLVAELAGSMALRGMSASDYAAHLGTTPGLISLALFALFALMPSLTRRP